MEPSFLTVTSAAPQLLTTLETVKEELGVADNKSNRILKRYIRVASSAASNYCRRTFIQQSYHETFRGTPFVDSASMVNNPLHLILRGAIPIISPIGTITIDEDIAGTGPLIEGIDFEVDYSVGMIYRLWNNLRMRWFFRQLDVDYNAGFTFADADTDTLPPDVEQAVILLVQELWSGRGRDNYLKQETIPGVYEAQYWVGSLSEPGQLPAQVQVKLDPYRITRFW
jgi:Phage gp6-like head-tail connector protein